MLALTRLSGGTGNWWLGPRKGYSVQWDRLVETLVSVEGVDCFIVDGGASGKEGGMLEYVVVFLRFTISDLILSPYFPSPKLLC